MVISAQERAERSAQAMWDADQASSWMGFKQEEIGPGSAILSMLIEPQHTNGHGICHGGIIFSLADSAFAFSCNSYNQSAVAQHNTISFITPGKLGDKLIATATEASRIGRSGIYDVRVTQQDGELIAVFRGCSRTIKGHHFEE